MKWCLCPLLVSVFALTVNAAARDTLLPAGTLLQCTLNEPNFSTSTASIGDPVLCHLRGLVEFGQEPFPRGSYLAGHLEAAKNPGHFVGKGYLELHFDRIGVPSGDMPVDAKIIAAGKYRVDREGKIRGKGHAKRDAVEWMFPPLWPLKIVMLPARGPRPKLKGETVLTLRLMDDVDIPQVAQTTFGSEWHSFSQPQQQSYRAVAPNEVQSPNSVQVPLRSTMAVPQVVSTGPRTFYTTFTPANSTLPDGIVTVPGMPVFVLKSGTLLAVSGYAYQSDRIAYALASGGTGVITNDAIDWPATLRVNEQRGVRVTLHESQGSQQGPGL
jgi:hypothetical protein